jgi:Bacterial SH3 domain/L,D-transpeptidase catalytic domain
MYIAVRRETKRSTAAVTRQPARVLAVCLLLVAVAVMAIGHSQNVAVASYTTTIDTDVLNLRDAPGTYGEVLTKMWEGEKVEVLDGPTEDGWYYVTYDGVEGWAYGGYLALDGVGGGGSGERWIDVDRSSQRVNLMEGDVLIASYWAAMGYDNSDDGYYATANGTYYVYDMYAPLNWSESGQVYFTHWVGFDPDRTNGFHSWSRDAEGYLIDGADGPTGGCVALEPSAAEVVYDFAEYGMRVEVHW